MREGKNEKVVKIVSYKGFKSKEEALKWLEKEMKRFEELRNKINKFFSEFEESFVKFFI